MAQQLPLEILLAEDNAVNQKVALHLLQRMGYKAAVAHNGMEALEALRQHPYNLVLMDVQMPKMDGITATRHIRRDWPFDRRPRIIAMTANVLEGDREACLLAGMDDYLTKPIRIESLIQALHRCHRSPEETAATIDWQALRYLQAAQSDSTARLAQRVIDAYLEDSPKQLRLMEQAMEAADLKALRQAAHALKSTSATVGATRLSGFCLAIEMACQRKNSITAMLLEQDPTPLTILAAEYHKVSQALTCERHTYL